MSGTGLPGLAAPGWGRHAVDEDMILSQVLAWFADPAHWRGPDGVGVRIAEHTQRGCAGSDPSAAGPLGDHQPALADGSITVMPEYTGNLPHFLDPASTAATADDVYAALRKALPPTLQVLQRSTAEDSDVLVVTQQTSASLGLASMAALAPHCPQPTLGAAGEWPARWKDKIASVYGCTFWQILSTDTGGPVTLEALRSGQAQVVNVFTTSPDITANHWVQLADPQHMYPAPRVVALVRAGVVNQAGIDALSRVSAALTTAKLTELDRRVTQDRAVPADLARDFVDGLR